MVKKDNCLDKFLITEENNKLFKLQIKGNYIWPIIRFNLYSLILQKSSKTQENHPKANAVNTLITFFRNFIPSIARSTFWIKRKKKTVILNHKRKIKNTEGLFECKYTEFLMDDNTYVFEAPFNDKHFKPYETKNVYYLDIILNIARIYGIYGSKSQISKEDTDKLNWLKNIVESEFNINIEDFNAFVLKMLYKHKATSFFAKHLLKKVKPEKLIVAVAYSDANMPFVEQAKKMGVKVIEIQHGIMGVNHVAYNFLKKDELTWFPDEIWVWSNYWKKSSRFPISEDRILVKGFPFLDRYKNNIRIKETDKKQFLIISQGPYSDELVGFASDLNRKLDQRKYQVIFKPHPSELATGRKKFERLTNENIIVSEKSNIYELQATAAYQIGVSSTALFEGLEFGLKTFILDIGRVNVWKGVEDIMIVNNEEDILNQLRD